MSSAPLVLEPVDAVPTAVDGGGSEPTRLRTIASALYTGRLEHHRTTAVEHHFTLPVTLAYLDLDELPRLPEWLPRGGGAWAPVRFERSDYLGDPAQPLGDAVRDLVAQHTGSRPTGPVRLLTQLRTLGYVFNPISLYWCFEPDGRRVGAVVAEVTNTPWKERHAYVLPLDPDGPVRAEFAKALHVSPFFGMDQTYRLSASRPGDHLTVRLDNLEQGEQVFSARLVLRRRPMTRGAWWADLARHPFPTHRVTMGIHTHALRLWRKGVPFVPHPSRHG